ncbi:MAG TPA: T9SS type A sorting domain-containing protein [Bacteroidetes bacterium]|nr:T9SS type A sorting domain-containing protein [Bacteroidota bacterium]
MKKIQLVLLLKILLAATLFGQQTVGLFLNDSLSVNGYTLFSNNRSTHLIDNCGFEVHRWESDFATQTSVYLLENGNLLRTCRIPGSFNAGGTAGRIELFNWEGELLWAYDYATEYYHQHHDIEPLPNGNFLLVAWEKKTEFEAQHMGRDPALVSQNGLWPEQVVEIEMLGTDSVNIVWQWHLWDHLVQDFDSTKVNYGNVAEHPELVDINYTGNIGGAGGGSADWVHINAIGYNPALDQIALSSRHFSEIWIIDHSTTALEAYGHTGGNSGKGGDLLYRWGNPAVYKRNGSQTLWGQHNVTWIQEEGHPFFGKLMVFNNGTGRPEGNYSSVDIWTPPVDADGSYTIGENGPFGPAALDWTFTRPGFFSSNISGAQSLPNGNILVCEGRKGVFFETTLDGQVVWEYVNPAQSSGGSIEQGTLPVGNSVFRATRYPAGYPAFTGRELSPGEPLELNPLPSDCIVYNDSMPLAGHETVLQNVGLLANPIGQSLRIENGTGLPVNIEIWDLTGRRLLAMKSAGEAISLDAAGWPKGLYVLRISNAGRSRFLVQKFVK